MKRVGIFAVEEGESYDDPFSLEVCEKMLSKNDGKWKTSRGFKVLEASGGCPHCGESLLIRTKHMYAGFKCPKCGKASLGFKGSLDDVRFLKTKTFDITVTDVPAVPWTGVAAFLPNNQEDVMKKKDLRSKLLAAGLSEEAVDARLESISEESLKSFDDIPDAEVLKHFEDEEDVSEVEKESKEQVFTLDPEVLKAFSEISKEQLTELLEGATLEAEDDDDEVEVVKESVLEEISILSDALKELTEKVDFLLQKDEDRLKELVSEAPRGSQLRISRFKSSKPAFKKRVEEPSDEEEEMEDEEEEEIPVKNKKKEFGGQIVGSDGLVAKSMTEFIRGTAEK